MILWTDSIWEEDLWEEPIFIRSTGIWNEAFWILGFLDRPYWEEDPLNPLRHPKYEYYAKYKYNDFLFSSRNKSIFQFKSRNKSEFKWVVTK